MCVCVDIFHLSNILFVASPSHQVGLETCPATLRVKASAKFIKNGQKGDFVANRLLCERLEWKVDIEIDLTISISKVVAWAQAVFQKIFTQPDQALTGGAEEVKIKIHHLQMPKFEISNMVGEEVLKDRIPFCFHSWEFGTFWHVT